MLLTLCFGVISIAGDAAFRSHSKFTEFSAVNHDGSRIIVEDSSASSYAARPVARVVDIDGKLIHKLGEVPWKRPPVWSRGESLVWIVEMPSGDWVVSKLDFTKKARVVQLLRTKHEVVAAFEDDFGRLIHAVAVKNREHNTHTTHHLVVFEDITTEIARVAIDDHESFFGSVVLDETNKLRMLVWVNLSTDSSLYDPFSDGNTDRYRRLILDRDAKEWAECSNFANTQHYVGNVARRSSDYATTQLTLYWSEDDTYVRWEYRGSSVEVYRPNQPTKTIACDSINSVLPGRNGKILVSTENGSLQVIDSRSGEVRTIRSVRKLGRAYTAFVCLGLPLCVLAWFWRTRNDTPDELSPLADVLLLLGVLALVLWSWLTCLLYTSPSPRDLSTSRMPSSA